MGGRTLGLVVLAALASDACSTRRADDAVVDLDGHAVDPLPLGSGATVLVFLASNCPISTRYLPELGRLRARFAGRGVAFDAVYPTSDASIDDVRAHARDLGAGFVALRDPHHVLVRRAEVAVTPEAAVLGPDGELRYHGRIDDRFVAFGTSRPDATRHELEDAIENVLAGRAAQPAAGSAIGCAIGDVELPAP